MRSSESGTLTVQRIKTVIELFKVFEWLQINKLSLNVKKTHFIIFHNRQKKIYIVPKINIDKNVLPNF